MHRLHEITRRSLLAGLAVAAIAPAAAGRTGAAGRAHIVNGSPSTGWTDFRFHREAMIILHGSLNGRPVRILIDSGVSHVIVSQAIAPTIGLRASGTARISAVAGRAAGTIYKALEIGVAGVRIISDQAIGADLSAVQQASGQAIDAIVGRDLFDSLIVDIDFARRKIAFHDPRSHRAPVGAVSIPARTLEGGDLRYIPLSVHGLPPVKATFDLGARAPLLMSPRYATRHGLMNGKRVGTLLSVGVAGPSASKIFSADVVNLAGLNLSGVPVTVPATWRNDERKIDSPIFVGVGLLSRFRIITDYPSDRIWFVPSPRTVSQAFRRDRSGLYLVLEGDVLRVAHVSAGSPAAASGWRADERVSAVNGRAVDSRYYDNGLYDWQYDEPGAAVILRLQDGSERRLTLANYY